MTFSTGTGLKNACFLIFSHGTAYTISTTNMTRHVLLIKPGMYPQVVKIGCELEDLQAAVGGDIEATYPFDDEVA